MYFPLTFVLLGLLTVMALVLRQLWWRIPTWFRKLLLRVALVAVLIRFLFLISQWSTTSLHVNDLLCWAGVIGYEILLVRFSLMRPQWLTVVCAIVLLMPLTGSTVLQPLTRVFYWSRADIVPIGGHYFCERSPWDTAGVGNSGMDLIIFYHPPFAPFLRHLVQRTAFGDDSCITSASRAVADPDKKLVYFYCPVRPDKHQLDIQYALPLR